MDESILTTIKKLLGIEESYEFFDTDIRIHINSALMALRQLGVGPEGGFSITDKTQTWEDFVGSYSMLDGVVTYVYLKVKLVFDPPASGTIVESINKTISELEWRLNTEVDE